MYKRYYDGYNTYPRSNTIYSGEVVIPREIEDEESAKIQEAPDIAEVQSEPEEQSTSAADSDVQLTVKDGEAAVAAMPRGGFPSMGGLNRILDDISIDDIILFGVILLVLKDSADDPLLIIILTVIFLSGLMDND